MVGLQSPQRGSSSGVNQLGKSLQLPEPPGPFSDMGLTQPRV